MSVNQDRKDQERQEHQKAKENLIAEFAKLKVGEKTYINDLSMMPRMAILEFMEKNPDIQLASQTTNFATYIHRIENRSDDPLQVHKVTEDEMFQWWDSLKDKKKKEEWDEVFQGYSIKRMFADLVRSGDIDIVDVITKIRNKPKPTKKEVKAPAKKTMKKVAAKKTVPKKTTTKKKVIWEPTDETKEVEMIFDFNGDVKQNLDIDFVRESSVKKSRKETLLEVKGKIVTVILNDYETIPCPNEEYQIIFKRPGKKPIDLVVFGNTLKPIKKKK